MDEVTLSSCSAQNKTIEKTLMPTTKPRIIHRLMQCTGKLKILNLINKVNDMLAD